MTARPVPPAAPAERHRPRAGAQPLGQAYQWGVTGTHGRGFSDSFEGPLHPAEGRHSLHTPNPEALRDALRDAPAG